MNTKQKLVVNIYSFNGDKRANIQKQSYKNREQNEMIYDLSMYTKIWTKENIKLLYIND